MKGRERVWNASRSHPGRRWWVSDRSERRISVWFRHDASRYLWNSRKSPTDCCACLPPTERAFQRSYSNTESNDRVLPKTKTLRSTWKRGLWHRLDGRVVCFEVSANRENWTQNNNERPRDRSTYFDSLLRADFETRIEGNGMKAQELRANRWLRWTVTRVGRLGRTGWQGPTQWSIRLLCRKPAESSGG